MWNSRTNGVDIIKIQKKSQSGIRDEGKKEEGEERKIG